MEPRGSVSCGSLGINDLNTQRPSKQKRTRQRESKVLLPLLLLLRPKLTYTLQKKERIQVKSRSSLEVRNGWMSIYEDQAPTLDRIDIREAWPAMFSDHHGAGDPSPVRLHSLAMDDVSPPRPERAVSLLSTF